MTVKPLSTNDTTDASCTQIDRVPAVDADVSRDKVVDEALMNELVRAVTAETGDATAQLLLTTNEPPCVPTISNREFVVTVTDCGMPANTGTACGAREDSSITLKAPASK